MSMSRNATHARIPRRKTDTRTPIAPPRDTWRAHATTLHHAGGWVRCQCGWEGRRDDLGTHLAPHYATARLGIRS
jgi:hypothetical protein